MKTTNEGHRQWKSEGPTIQTQILSVENNNTDSNIVCEQHMSRRGHK